MQRLPAEATPTAPSPDSLPATASIERALRVLTQHGRLARLHQHLNRVAGVDLDRPAYIAMACLDEAGELGLSALAEASGVDVSTMSRLVDRLVATSLVEAGRSASDQRAVLLRLTGTGQALVGRLKAVRRQVLAQVLASWTPDEQATFASLLTRFASELERVTCEPRR